jgi:hypothetical protein
LKLLESSFDTWRGHRLRAVQAALGYEPLDLPWVTFIFDPSIEPSDDTVQHSAFFRVVRPRPHARSHRQLVLLGQCCFKPVKRVGWTATGEIIPMYRRCDLFFVVAKYIG